MIISEYDIITEGLETLKAGSSRLWTGIAAPLPGRPFFRAVNAEILIADEPKIRSVLIEALTNPANQWERLISQATRL